MKVLNFRNRKTELFSLPIGLALDEATDEIVSAERGRDGLIEVKRLPREESRITNITAHDIYSVVTDWKARRRALLTEFSHNTNSITIDRFIDANAKGLIDATLEERSCDWSHTGRGILNITDVRRDITDRTSEVLSEWISRQSAPHINLSKPRIHLDTAAGNLIRTWLRANHNSTGAQTNLEYPKRTIAIVGVNEKGFTIGIWSRETGLVCELQDPFDSEGSIDIALRHVCDMVTALIAPEEIASIAPNLSPVSYLVISADHGIFKSIFSLLNRTITDIPIERLKLSSTSIRCAEEERYTLAAALAVGAIIDEPSVPRVDLAKDVYIRLAIAEVEAKQSSEAFQRRKRVVAKRAILAPTALVLGACLAWYTSIYIENLQIRFSKAVAEVEADELKQELAWRNTAEKNLNWYKDFGQLVVQLREQQPAAVRLLIELNRFWPEEDKSWWVSNLKELGNGVIEIKGKTRSEESILKFVKDLENTNGTFTNVRFDFRRPVESEGKIGEVVDYGVWFTYKPLADLAMLEASPSNSDKSNQKLNSSSPAKSSNQSIGSVN
jgi:hypothetical protein